MTKQDIKFAGVFGTIHLLIDLVTVSAAFAVSHRYHLPVWVGISVIVLYDVLAFAGQAVIGWFSDRSHNYKRVALAGIVMVLASAPIVSVSPVAALIWTAVGNAFFHVGAGALSLCAAKGRATIPGIFVAPGAIGLGIGTLFGKNDIYVSWIFVAIMAIAFLVALQTRSPHVPCATPPVPRRLLQVSHPRLAIFALLASIAIRALVGFGGAASCKKTMAVKIGLMSVAFLGKGAGGIISDKIGWIPGSVGALLISAPLIAFLGDEPLALIVGFLFFQMTMPVTLVAVSETMPGRPGLAFGLCCLALLGGSLLSFSTAVKAFYSNGFFFGLILVSATLVYFSLGHIQKKIPMKF